MKHSRRTMIAGTWAAVAGCGLAPDWCEGQLRTDDGPFPYPDTCPPTADDIEGPYYRADAPQRENLDLHEDTGIPLSLSGQVFEQDCSTPLAGATVDFWHADPAGSYDNSSDEMRYRCRVTTDDRGRYTLRTLLPGHYAAGSSTRPRHIHVKVFDAAGSDRLTTQLYFDGDPYLDCDPFANTSLVLPFAGTIDTEMVAENVHFVLA